MASQPVCWLDFLHRLWPDDEQSIETLQEWFGYIVSGRLGLHKILLVVGPTRSGKGSIARVLEALIGTTNCAGPTLASLRTNFGLAPLIGKPLAVISDARLDGADTASVVERLLSVSCEDELTIDRKYREAWTGTGTLPTRFMVLSNELPRFGDASGVIANRFVILSLTESWLGREDFDLGGKLQAELPAILSWALDGLQRLNDRGRMTEPQSSRDAVEGAHRALTGEAICVYLVDANRPARLDRQPGVLDQVGVLGQEPGPPALVPVTVQLLPV